MEAADREVIKEFLVSLGFKVDEPGLDKFGGAIGKISKRAAAATGVIAGLAVMAERMVKVFAANMEKLFYASKRTDAAVQNIQALEFGAEQIGLTADGARASLEAMARSIRLNPGILALLENLGVRTSGKDRVEVLTDLIKQLRQMPFYVGAQFAEMFGIDSDTYLHLSQNLETLLGAMEKRRQMNRDAAIDTAAVAAASRDYMNILRELWQRVEILGQTLAVKLLPVFKILMTTVNGFIQDFQKWSTSLSEDDVKEFLVLIRELLDSFRQLGAAMKELWSEHGERIKAMFFVMRVGAMNLAKAVIGIVDSVLLLTSGQWMKAWSRLKRTWDDLTAEPASDAERRANEMMGSPVPQGSRDQNADGFPKESGGERLAAALRSMGILRSEQAGDPNNESLQREIARTEALIGNLRGRGFMPQGAFPSTFSSSPGGEGGRSVVIQQKTEIIVSGDGAAATGAAVAREQGRVNGDLVRNAEGVVR